MLEQWKIILQALAVVLAVLGLGVIGRRLKLLKPAWDRALLRIIIWGFLPCLIFSVVAGQPAFREMGKVLTPPMVGFFAVVAGFVVASVFARYARKPIGLKSATQRRTFGYSVGVFNYGYLPIPLISILFDQTTVGVLFLHNAGVELAFWTVGMIVLTGGLTKGWWHGAINPPSVTIFVALLFNWMGLSDHVSEQTFDALNLLGKASIPLGLILVGATIADHLHEVGLRSGWRVVAAACMLRLAVIPAVFLVAAKLLPVSIELKRVIVVEAAMPAAVFSIVMARHYRGDTPTAMRVIIGTSIVCLVTTPLCLKFGMWFVGVG